MTNQIREVYERGNLDQLIKNAERLAVIERDVIEIKPHVETTDQAVTELNSKVNSIETQLKTIQEKVSGLEEKVSGLDAKLNWVLGLLIAIGTSILATLYTQPILTALGKS